MKGKLELPKEGIFGVGNQESKKENKNVSNGVSSESESNAIESVTKKESRNVNKPVSKNESEIENKNNTFLTITRKKVTQYTIPMTYRLRAETIETIRDNARIANMGVAEYLQAVLDLVLDKINIK